MATTNLTSSSAMFRALLENITLISPVDSAVLLQEETEKSREVVARAIHEARRRDSVFRPNCAAEPGWLTFKINRHSESAQMTVEMEIDEGLHQSFRAALFLTDWSWCPSPCRRRPPCRVNEPFALRAGAR